ncbi:MAG: HEAT repeat domain-containing protein [Mariniphaga sp.]|nr:HEAT repeat domain-containing protein [Mariniphaga sp.]
METQTLIIIYIILVVITIVFVVLKKTTWFSIIGVALFPIYFLFVLYDAFRTSDNTATDDSIPKELPTELKLPVPTLGDEAKKLVTDLENEDPKVRTEAARLLAESDDPGAAYYLIKAIKDEDDKVSGQAAYSLSRIGKSGIEYCLWALKHTDPRIRKSAVQALGNMDDDRIIQQLIIALNDKTPSVRTEVPMALGNASALIRMRNNDRTINYHVVEKLIAQLKSKNPDMVREVIDTLTLMTGQNLGDNINRWQQWWVENKR